VFSRDWSADGCSPDLGRGRGVGDLADIAVLVGGGAQRGVEAGLLASHRKFLPVGGGRASQNRVGVDSSETVGALSAWGWGRVGAGSSRGDRRGGMGPGLGQGQRQTRRQGRRWGAQTVRATTQAWGSGAVPASQTPGPRVWP